MSSPHSPGRTLVVKIGGSMMDDESALAGLCSSLAGLRSQGLSLVLVHGGGKDINRHLTWLKEEPVFRDGLRVTSPAALRIVEMTLSGYVNKKLVGLLNAGGAAAAGISGVDGPTFLCEAISPELGQVGRIVEVRTALVTSLLAAGFLPVVSPISVDAGQAHFNVNADDAASALAVALKAERLLFVSDVDGVRGRDGNRISRLDWHGVETLIQDGTATGGMVPKLRSCLAALASGVGQVHICSWPGPVRFAAEVRGETAGGTIIAETA